MRVEWKEIEEGYYIAEPSKRILLTARPMASGYESTARYRGGRIHIKYTKTLRSAQQSAASALQRLVDDVRGITDAH